MGITPEDRERIRREAQEIRDRVLRGEPKPPKVRAPRKAHTGLKRGENLRGRPPKYDRDQIARLFHAGHTVAEIARTIGAHRATVATALNDLGIDPSQRRGGPARRAKCGKGLHDMAEHGREIPSGGRYCAACKAQREKDRVTGSI